MIRLLGAITGSALALAALLLLVGVPQFRTDTPDIERAIVRLPVATTAVEAARTGEADAADAPDEVHPAAPPVEPESTAAAEKPPQPVHEEPANEQPVNAGTDDEPAEAGPPPVEDARDWYAFWSPFRSELAAAGFVGQLQRVTGLDYRVVKVRTGVYEVAFAYRDDADIDVNLSQITAATGLEMAER